MVDIQALFANQMKTMDKESIQKGRNFKTNPTDVMVSTSPKCGTTWVTHICHMLRSNGEEVNGTFDRRVPWDVMATAAGIDVEADQGFKPRVFKSHETMDDIANGAKYVLVFRNPQDAFVSYYNMMLNIFHVTSAQLTIVDFAKRTLTSSPAFSSWAKFTDSALSAYKTNSENILFLYYEDLKEDRMTAVRKIAEFMGLEQTLSAEQFKERCEIAYEKSSFEYMKAHPEATEARDILTYMDKASNRTQTREEFAVTVSKGQVGGGKNLPESIKEQLRSDWKSFVEINHGYTSYEEFRNSNK